MERGRPTHCPDIIVADVGDLMGQDAGDLIPRHAAQQPLGQYDRGAFRTAQRVGIHIARSREAISVRQSRQAGSRANVRQDAEQSWQFGRTQRADTEPPKDGFARDCRTVWSWRASRKRLVNPLSSTDDPAAYRKQ